MGYERGLWGEKGSGGCAGDRLRWGPSTQDDGENKQRQKQEQILGCASTPVNKIVRWGPRLRAWMTNGEGEGQRVSEGRALRAERACGSMVRASRGLIIQWAKAHFPTAEAVGLSKASSSSALCHPSEQVRSVGTPVRAWMTNGEAAALRV